MMVKGLSGVGYVTNINHNYNKICDFLGLFFFKLKHKNSEILRVFLSAVKNAILVHVYYGVYCPIT